MSNILTRGLLFSPDLTETEVDLVRGLPVENSRRLEIGFAFIAFYFGTKQLPITIVSLD